MSIPGYFKRFLRILGITGNPNAVGPVFDEKGQMVPPWIRFPYIARFSMGWRMGDGEQYMGEFVEWWDAQSEDAKTAYKARYRPPLDWLGFYKILSFR